MMEWISQYLFNISHYPGGFTLNVSYTTTLFIGFVVYSWVKKVLVRRRQQG